MPAAEYRRKAASYYESGADGLLFWDTYQRHDGGSQWQTIRRLGHIDELTDPVAAGAHPEDPGPKILPLLRLAGHHMHRYSPYRGA